MNASNNLADRDIAHHLHSYTNAAEHRSVGPLIIEGGDGIYVTDKSGKKYMEGMSGLWNVGLGFSEKRLVQAACDQLQKLPVYHTFYHKANTPSILLADKLSELTHGRMAQAFFTNSGSEANDTIVKMVWYYNNALGRHKKKKFIAHTRGYHGVTIASGSLTGIARNHKDFDLPLPQMRHIRCPHWYRESALDESEEAFCNRLATELEQLIEREGPDTVAAFIGEPILGAGGVVVPPAGYWQKIQAICKKYDILLIADEVITGFGRTGHMFGSDLFGIQPDFMTLSKQLTSSYMPLAAVLLSDKVDQVITRHSGELGIFGHGFTASGHPVATAVAVENIRIIEERNLVEHARQVGAILQQRFKALLDHPLVGEVRGVGLIGAIELVADKSTRKPFDPALKLGARVIGAAQENGLILRSVGDAITFCPPLIITESELNKMMDIFEKSLASVAKEL